MQDFIWIRCFPLIDAFGLASEKDSRVFIQVIAGEASKVEALPEAKLLYNPVAKKIIVESYFDSKQKKHERFGIKQTTYYHSCKSLRSLLMVTYQRLISVGKEGCCTTTIRAKL